MTNWVEYYHDNREVVRVVGSYVPKVGNEVILKLKKVFNTCKVVRVNHLIDKTDVIKEKFQVFLE